jgi:hypothetical protein
MKRDLIPYLVCVTIFLFWVPSAWAQEGRDPEDRIEIEGHFGFYGNLAFPATRRENPAYTAFLETRIPPEDHALFRPNLRSRKLRWELGARVSYDLTPRWALEYGFAYTQGGAFKLSDDYLNNVLPAALAANPNISVIELQRSDGRVWIHSLNAVYHLRERGRWVPYLTGGVNAVRFGHGPRVEAVRDEPGILFDVFERGRFSYDNRFTRWGGNAGGGLKLYLRRHFGLRADARFLFTDSEFTQRAAVTREVFFIGLFRSRFGPDITSQQRGLYSNLHVTFGVFGRF